jgi:hypothetical protein
MWRCDAAMSKAPREQPCHAEAARNTETQKPSESCARCNALTSGPLQFLVVERPPFCQYVNVRHRLIADGTETMFQAPRLHT